MIIAEWITAAVGVLALSGAMIRWVSRMEANTAATEELTSTMKAFIPETTKTLTDHEVRISVLEAGK